MKYLMMLAALALAACSGSNVKDVAMTTFANTTAYGLKAGQDVTGKPEVILGSATGNLAFVPNVSPQGDLLNSRSEEGAQGTASWKMSEDGRSVYSCFGSDSLLGRSNDVGVDAIFATGTAAGHSALYSACSRGAPVDSLN